MNKVARTLTAEKPLTPKQELFCIEYLKDLNVTQAAIRAGYSERTARTIGTENMSKPAVRARIDAAKGERMERVQVDADWVVNRLVAVVERCMQAEPVMIFTGKAMEQKTDEEGRGVYQFDSAGANKALETLGKHLPDFFGKKAEGEGAAVIWNEHKTYIDARSQHVHTHTGVTGEHDQPTPTPQRLENSSPHHTSPSNQPKQ